MLSFKVSSVRMQVSVLLASPVRNDLSFLVSRLRSSCQESASGACQIPADPAIWNFDVIWMQRWTPEKEP